MGFLSLKEASFIIWGNKFSFLLSTISILFYKSETLIKKMNLKKRLILNNDNPVYYIDLLPKEVEGIILWT